ncbi:MFS transporter [Lolliginicoccus levis]|uniref:MFS transporter n=1 Tax=Lolliginicoccus levis TaxID=2919542 RepID=UPI00241D670C|nr:MFS transporter [Lolliginicoccus levis]
MPPYLPSQAVDAEPATVPRLAAPAQPAPRLAWRGRALVLLGIVLAAFTLRLAVTSFTPLLAEIGTDIGFGSVMAGVFGMSAPAMFAIAGITAPRIMARIELERVALLSVALTTAGLALRPLMGSSTPMLAATMLALYGMGIGNIVLPPLVKRYFSDRLALISTLYITFVQLGTVVPAVVAIPVADQHGWRASLAIWAFVAAAAVLPWIGLRNAFKGNASRSNASTTAPGTAGDASHTLIATPPTGRPWRSPVGWGLAVMFGMTSLITYSFLTWLPTMLTDAGVDRVDAGAYLGVFIFSGLLAIMVVPAITTRMTNPFPLALASMIALAIGMAGLAIAPAAFPLAWAILLGLGPATFPMALTLINLRTRSAHAAGALSGFTQGVGYLLACGGPLLVGLLHDATGGWNLALGLLAVAMVTLITGAFHACKPRVIEDTWN